MPKQRIDGVIEAVHFNREGMVDWVRAYMRRGRTYSDRIIIRRSDLIDRIKSGNRIYTGQRIPLQASTFQLDRLVNVIHAGAKDLISATETSIEKDELGRVPAI